MWSVRTWVGKVEYSARVGGQTFSLQSVYKRRQGSYLPSVILWLPSLMVGVLMTKKRNPRNALDPIVTDVSSGPSKLELVQNVFMAPFHHKKRDSTRILSDCKSQLLTWPPFVLILLYSSTCNNDPSNDEFSIDDSFTAASICW